MTRYPAITCALLALLCTTALSHALAAEQDAPDYGQIAPLLRKYCAGCHNAEDREGDLALDSFDGIVQGGEHGAVITPKRGDLSRLIRVLTGQAEPLMPPEGEARPSDAEVALITAWIDAGAKGPDGGELDPTILITPKIKPTADVRNSINALSLSHDGQWIAIARYGEVEIIQRTDGATTWQLKGHRGHVNSVSFSADNKLLIAAAGEAGLFGEVRMWDVASGELLKIFQGHRDSIYSAALSPNSSLLATGSYDKTITIWDVPSGTELRTLTGHNAAVFDVAFHPSGKILASASGDRTVKLWDVESGRRLDTLGQSLQELYTLAFAPNGRRLAAGGVDNRIRVWRISPTAKEGTNPLLFSVFAHDAPILRLAFSGNGRRIVSSGEDGTVKVWNAGRVTLRSTLDEQTDWVTGLDITQDGRFLLAGRRDGSFEQYDLATVVVESAGEAEPLEDGIVMSADGEAQIAELPKQQEVEPNDDELTAKPITVPGIAVGRIHSDQSDKLTDVDLYRFNAKKGDVWLIETNAARSGAPLDTKIEVLHEDGTPVQRCVLRAVRDSEVTFRGINSDQLDCRVVNWEEMELNEYLYIAGEVLKLYRAPQGPDSGFTFYPNMGKRFCYFDTSARAHPLGQPCYIVVPYPVGTQLPDNGLPVFPLYYENDDDAQRTLGSDSRLTFTAPTDSAYLVRVSDVRGFYGEDFKYALTIRHPQPDFKVTLSGANPTVNAGGGKSFSVRADRQDNFDGPIRIDIEGLPPGFSVTSPLVIEGGHIEAHGVINARPDASQPTEENWSKTKVTATSEIGGREVSHDVNNFGTIKLAEKSKLIVHLELDDPSGENPDPTSTESKDRERKTMPELNIAPGTTVTCKLRVERNGFDDRIQFDVNNLPHGVIVDDIGLNGVLIPEGQTERTIFLKAASWVPETSRPFHAVAKVEGNQASLPMLLQVRRAELAANDAGE